ncbi:MAG TPA: helix-turn-helix domain-containing protein [Ktedonobacterales bacterium]|nr:helix-turn-helix domain-containing protein [Ktedonobacterales bacterium]
MTDDDRPVEPPRDLGKATNASDIPETYELETLEQLRAIADELRSRIAEALTHRAMTVTQLGELLGQAPAKIHYHVRELERVGLVRLVATREKSGILEKYYRAIARSFNASKTLLLNAPSDETFAAMRSFLDSASRAFLRATEYTMRNQLWDSPKVWGLSTAQIWVTYDELNALAHRVQQEFDKFSTPRGVEGEEERTIVMMGYDPRVVADESSADTSSLTPPPLPLTVPPPPESAPPTPGARKPRVHRIVSAGATSFDRAQLEEALAKNQQLDISVMGVCIFASDVTADLIDRVIHHFRHRGILTASSEVREALKRKET